MSQDDSSENVGWKVLHASAAGTSHAATNASCQDAAAVRQMGEWVVLAASDGAGSAKHAEEGAQAACHAAVEAAAAHWSAAPDALDEQTLRKWIDAAHRAVVDRAEALGAAPRDLACTLLLAVLGPAACAFAQIGDGAIITRTADGTLAPVFWPDSGEYHNTTFFVSDPAYASHLRVEHRAEPPGDTALLTDGLQMLALRYAERAAHGPFFEPMLDALRGAADAQTLLEPLRAFLTSPAVNARTDDDKTLVLAVRNLDVAQPEAADERPAV